MWGMGECQDARAVAVIEALCVLCAIVADEQPAQIVYDDGENGDCIAFLDRTPLFKGHVLLVPRTHYETLADVPPEVLGPLFVHTQRLSSAMETVLGAPGSLAPMKTTAVSQSMPHLHVHVVPRNEKDGLKGFFWPRTNYADDDEMAASRENRPPIPSADAVHDSICSGACYTPTAPSRHRNGGCSSCWYRIAERVFGTGQGGVSVDRHDAGYISAPSLGA